MSYYGDHPNIEKKKPSNWKDCQTHGGKSSAVRRRYKDSRTQEGRWLKAIRESLIASIGGAGELTPAQGVVLGLFESKLILLKQISDYIDSQESVIDKTTGELMPALNQTFLRYSESARRDLEVFHGLSRVHKSGKNIPTLDEIMRADKESS